MNPQARTDEGSLHERTDLGVRQSRALQENGHVGQLVQPVTLGCWMLVESVVVAIEFGLRTCGQAMTRVHGLGRENLEFLGTQIQLLCGQQLSHDWAGPIFLECLEYFVPAGAELPQIAAGHEERTVER